MTLALLFGALLCLVVAFAPRLHRHASTRAARAALPALIEALGAALACGLSLTLAFAELAGTLPEPLATRSRRAAASLRLGYGADRALDAFADVVPAADLAPLALILAAFERSGGRVRSSLGRCAALLRGRLALEEERAALTAQARLSALVLVALPPLAAAFFAILMPSATIELVQRAPLLVLLAIALELAGAAWLAHLVRSRTATTDLASVLDAVVVGLDAGLSLPSALGALAARSSQLTTVPGIRALLADAALGRPQREAFAAFAAAGAAQARVAGLALASARLGAPLAELLVAQADALRDEARQRAQTDARRLPVLMLFPLALCVLPALLIVFIAPPLLTLTD